MDDNLREILLKVKAQKDIKSEIPGLKGQLEPHQRVAVAFCVLSHRSLILDFLGAGKTVEAIATDLKLRSLGRVMRTLVVCGGGKRWDWRDEIQRFTDLNVYLVDGSKENRTNIWLQGAQDFGVTVAHYESVRGDFLEKYQDEKKRNHYRASHLGSYLKYDHIIFDEVSTFKGDSTVLHDALMTLVEQNPKAAVIGLSATPVQKSLEDLHSIMSIIDPSVLPPKEDFDFRYLIKKTFQNYSGKGSFQKVIGHKNVEEVAYLMAPKFIRREKAEVYGDDKLKHVPIIRSVELTPAQQKKYNQLKDSVENHGRGSLITVFGEMEKCCDTMNYFNGNATDSAKIDDLKFLLMEELKDEKVIIFSKHHRPHEQIEKLILIPEGIKYINYSGKIDMEEREKGRMRFLNDPEVRVALLTTAGEMGYNFHSAHYMVFINHVYNQARIDQIIGRIDRPIVQKSNFICTIHYVCKGTFEEKVIPQFKRDAGLSKQIFGASNRYEDYDLLEGMSDDELYNLIRTGDTKVRQDSFKLK